MTAANPPMCGSPVWVDYGTAASIRKGLLNRTVPRKDVPHRIDKEPPPSYFQVVTSRCFTRFTDSLEFAEGVLLLLHGQGHSRTSSGGHALPSESKQRACCYCCIANATYARPHEAMPSLSASDPYLFRV